MGKYCSKCGAILQEETKFCKMCGSNIEAGKNEIESKENMQIIYKFMDLDKEKEQYKKIEKKYICDSKGACAWSALLWIISCICYIVLFWYISAFASVFYLMINVAWKAFDLYRELEDDFSKEWIRISDDSRTSIKLHNIYKSIIVNIGTTGMFVYSALFLYSGPLYVYSHIFPIAQINILVLMNVIGWVIGKKRLIKVEKELNDIRKYNDSVFEKRRDKEIDIQKFNRISEVKDEKIIGYMNKAILLLNNGEYEDSTANVRRALEYDLYKRIESDGEMLADENKMNIWGYLDFYNNSQKYDCDLETENNIRRVCNTAVHPFNNINCDDESNDLCMQRGEGCIKDMLSVLSWDCKRFEIIPEQQKKIDDNIKLYEKKSEQYIKNENFEDALLNIRKTLESVVNGYIKAFHIICLYGHEKNLKGYIDLLFEKKIISENSKNNMHNIRMSCNGSAHINNKTESISKIQNLIKLMKKEEDIYFNKKDIEDTNKMIKENTDNEDPNIDFDISSDNYSEEEYSDFEEVYNNVNNDNPDNNNYYCEEEEDNYYKNDNTYRNPKHYGDPFYETDPFIQTDPYINNPWGAESIYEHDGYDED